ncbi:hypothetical protein SAMN00790413_05856 [Deinococcus hopiensis KR-140]|uniref:Uncharacterized protein n=1 Tax=Deinococcus hopiensis KR-140 TaxID=695939 RepID=A0A1W1UEM3_9DEIO|nr:hypothetical protein SAMN00790413_05856 [Deinococcus hopiensis KR-140]
MPAAIPGTGPPFFMSVLYCLRQMPRDLGAFLGLIYALEFFPNIGEFSLSSHAGSWVPC